MTTVKKDLDAAQNGGTQGLLRDAGLRPTRQRMALADILFGGPDRHITAEALYQEARTSGVNVSLATIYNALHDFTTAGLLREVAVDSARSYFDTNTSNHHHFFFEKTGQLTDIPSNGIQVTGLPETPEGHEVSRVDVIVRVTS